MIKDKIDSIGLKWIMVFSWRNLLFPFFSPFPPQILYSRCYVIHHRCAFAYPSLLFSLHLLFHFLLIVFTNGNKPRVFFSSTKALFSSPLSSHISKKCNITCYPLPTTSVALSTHIFIRFSYFHYVYFFDRLNHCLLQRLLITK